MSKRPLYTYSLTTEAQRVKRRQVRRRKRLAAQKAWRRKNPREGERRSTRHL